MKIIHRILNSMSDALRKHHSASPEEKEMRARKELDMKVKLSRMRSL